MDFHITEEHKQMQHRCRRLAEDFATRAAAHDYEASNYLTEDYVMPSPMFCSEARRCLKRALRGWSSSRISGCLLFPRALQTAVKRSATTKEGYVCE
jgi:hypothetical protein